MRIVTVLLALLAVSCSSGTAVVSSTVPASTTAAVSSTVVSTTAAASTTTTAGVSCSDYAHALKGVLGDYRVTSGAAQSVIDRYPGDMSKQEAVDVMLLATGQVEDQVDVLEGLDGPPPEFVEVYGLLYRAFLDLERGYIVLTKAIVNDSAELWGTALESVIRAGDEMGQVDAAMPDSCSP